MQSIDRKKSANILHYDVLYLAKGNLVKLDLKHLLSRPTMDIADAEQVLGVSKLSVQTAIRRGHISAIKVGKRVKVLTGSVRRLLGEVA
jgi:hypothetical protein